MVFCVLASPIYAVINKSPQEADRREAPLDTYGPPSQDIPLPAAIYGQPAVARYPPPPPDIPPPLPQPHREYGVPVKYGPPKVQVEYGPPPYRNIVSINSLCALKIQLKILLIDMLYSLNVDNLFRLLKYNFSVIHGKYLNLKRKKTL